MTTPPFTVAPVAFVRGGRESATDDFWGGTVSRIELAEGVPSDSLDGIEDFSHAEVLFVFDRVDEARIVTGARRPRNNPDWPLVGIFAQRGKNRPNRIGCAVVRILGREERTLLVGELDATEGSPVIDIKPVMAEYLPREAVRQPAWSHEVMCDYWTAGA